MKPVQTLDDIARLANVSRSTVSRALNDSPLLSQATKERIQAIAREHQFRVNVAARNLRLRTSRTIAFVAPGLAANCFSPENPFGLEMLGSISYGLRMLDYDCLIVQRDPHDSAWARNYLESGRAGGFIVIGSDTVSFDIETLVTLKAPFIVWGAPVPPWQYCTVTGDNAAGGRLATEHLIRSGRRRIGFIGGPEDTATAQDRLQGYRQAFAAAARPVDPTVVVAGDYSYESGGEAMGRLLDQASDLDAVFVTGDLMAIAAITAIQARGKRVPEDIAVVGYDDLAIARYSTLPLTTIRQNIPMAGQLLAQTLITHIETGQITNVTVPVELVVRQSA